MKPLYHPTIPIYTATQICPSVMTLLNRLTGLRDSRRPRTSAATSTSTTFSSESESDSSSSATESFAIFSWNDESSDKRFDAARTSDRWRSIAELCSGWGVTLRTSLGRCGRGADLALGLAFEVKVEKGAMIG